MSDIRENLYMFDEATMAEHDKQIRADAIENLEDAIINAFDDNNEKWTVISFLQKVHEIAQKQLKEQ